MSGVRVFKEGVVRLIENPKQIGRKMKVIVYVPTNEVIMSNEMLEKKLSGLGWEPYPPTNPSLLHFHQRSTVHLITVPKDFSSMSTVHMYDIVVKTRNIFEVEDVVNA